MLRRWLLWLLRDEIPTHSELAAIRREWEETLGNLRTYFARHAKREKRDLERLLAPDPPQQPEEPTVADRAALKAHLRRQMVAGGRGRTSMQAPPAKIEESG